jgi:hypothetical protein
MILPVVVLGVTAIATTKMKRTVLFVVTFG